MDNIDRELINLLMIDAKQSSEVLGKQLMVSSATIRRRINNLMKQGILRLVALPDPTKTGLPVRVVIALNVTTEKLDQISQQLVAHSEIVFLAATSGRFDIIAIAWFSSTDNLYNFLQKVIGKLDGIRTAETFICLEVKRSIAPIKS